MKGYLSQEWINAVIFFNSVTGLRKRFTQPEAGWLALPPCTNLVVTLEVLSVVTPLPADATGVVILYETAPARDESLFAPMPTGVELTSGVSLFVQGSTTVPIVRDVKSILLTQTPTVPVSEWFRWTLALTGLASADGNWGGSFRLHVATGGGG